MRKQKKRYAAMLCAALLLGTGLHAAAGELDLNGIEVSEKSLMQESDAYLPQVEESEKSIFDNGSTDIVTISAEGLYTVEMPELHMSIYPPFGWICLTQDLGAQFDLYSLFYDDPMAISTAMVNDGIHFLMIDSALEVKVLAVVTQDSLSKVVGDTENLSQSDEELVLEMLSESVFPGEEVSVVTLGGRRYFSFVSADRSYAVYETVVNGMCIDLVMSTMTSSTLTDQNLEDMEYLLMDAAFTA